MGTEYFFYPETKYKGRWQSLCPVYPCQDGSYKAIPALEGKSFYREAVRESASRTFYGQLPDDVSDAVKDAIIRSFEDESLEDSMFEIINFSDLKGRVRSADEPLYFGYVLKKTILEYEADIIDFIDDFLTDAEYGALPKEKRAAYRFYHWDDSFGNGYKGMQTVVRTVDYLFDRFSRFQFENHWEEDLFERIQEAEGTIRLIVEVSY